VINATDMVFRSSMAASRRRVIPIAHKGANWGRRELLSVNRLVNKAMPATQRLGLQRGLIQEVAAIQPEFVLQRRYQRRNRDGSDTQAQPRLRDFRKAPGQRRKIDGHLAFWIAVIRIDADHLQRPVSARRRNLDPVAEAEFHPSRQLFTDEAGIARAKTYPGPFG
jgi:hypothetical protein